MILYKFYWDCGRMGDLDGLFVAEPEEVEALYGKKIYFGEVLGKHSEIYGTFNPEDVTVISTDQKKIKWLVSVIGFTTISGFNPLDYYEEEEYEDD